MSMNDSPSSIRYHIAFVGKTNSGKSSLVNAISNQSMSIVSDIKGTTTDPVSKSMEILPLGPVVLIDTAGIDDDSALGKERTKKTNLVLGKADICVYVLDSSKKITDADINALKDIENKKIPYIIVQNKADLKDAKDQTKVIKEKNLHPSDILFVSANNKNDIHALKETIAHIKKEIGPDKKILEGLVKEKDTVMLVIPIDESAPKGRLILPQQQVLREILDSHAISICCQVNEISYYLYEKNIRPCLVITDSQAFGAVSKIVPKDIPLTSFSILFARFKGEIDELIKGSDAIKNIKSEDTVLISEGCTHHRQCKDIGSVKIPDWVREYSKSAPAFEFTNGNEFPDDTSKYKLIIHCGGCMLNEKEMKRRQEIARKCGTPMVNYGIAIAKMHGILDRSIEVLDL